jgi:hypothetical protein
MSKWGTVVQHSKRRVHLFLWLAPQLASRGRRHSVQPRVKALASPGSRTKQGHHLHLHLRLGITG